MNKIHCHFYCVQPLSIDNDLLLELFERPLDINKIKTIVDTNNKKPIWFEKFISIKNIYNSLELIDLGDKVNIKHLVTALETHSKVNQRHSLAPYLDKENTSYYLFFDYRLAYFNLVYELSFCFDEFQLPDFLDANQEGSDFYNTVRNLMVRENVASQLSLWAKSIQSSAIATVNTLIKSQYGIVSRDNSVKILNNTGNISNIVSFGDYSGSDKEQLMQNFIALNNKAERVENIIPPINLKENISSSNVVDLYHFNGRFHTILLSDNKDQYRYVPIQFHVQYVWFYIVRLNSILEDFNDQVIIQQKHKGLGEKERVIDILVSRVDILNLFHEGFKFSIETDNSRIYEKIENQWNIEIALRTTNRYMGNFKNYLERLQARKSVAIERKQNKILFFITIFQFIALLSVWVDYLSLLDHESTSKATAIISLVGSVERFNLINLYLPFGFIGIITAMFAYVYMRKK